MPRPLKTKPAMYWITRHEASWRVHITDGKIDSGQVYFKDSEHGSRRRSLQMAKTFRDDFVAQHKIRRRVYDGDGFYARHARSVSGLVAVRLIVDNRDAPTRVNWQAKVTAGGAEKGKSFSVRRYGYEAAWRKAAQIRCARTGEPIPDRPPKPPAWLPGWARGRKLVALAQEMESLRATGATQVGNEEG